MSESKRKEYEKPENMINPINKFSSEVNNLKKVFRGRQGFEDVGTLRH